MKKVLYSLLLLAFLSGAFLAGSWYNQREVAKVNPPVVKSPAVNPGKTPEIDKDADISSLPPGTVRINSEKQQAIGVRVASVEKKPVAHILRVLGRVAPDETRIYRINAAIDGWITEALPKRVGSIVKKNETLASFYSKEILGAQQAYLYALGTAGVYQAPQVPGKEIPPQGALSKTNVQLYRDSLKILGMSELQIEELARTRQYTQTINIVSPADGFVLVRNVSQDERFEKGKEFYRIADLSRVWIVADVFENEGSYFKAGMKVKVRLPNQNRTFQAKISNVPPVFDSTTRTLKVGLEADNPDHFLRPEMFVDVELPIDLPPAVTVPADAVLDSGLKKTVFVDRGNGFFEPREVETGWRAGSRVEIVRGLEPGERIVISGNFLIDSESKLEMAAAGMQGALSKDPVCGLEISPKKAEKAGRKIAYGGKTYYFCSDECKERFEKESNRFIKTNADATPAEGAPSRNPRKNQGHDHS